MRLTDQNGGYSAHYKQSVATAALEVLSSAFNVSVSKMMMATRQKASISMARQIAMYLCHVVGQLSLREIAVQFDREPSTISHACHVVEDRRDNPVFDRQIALLEEAMRDRVRDLIDTYVAGTGTPSSAGNVAGLDRLEMKCVAVA